MASEQTVFSELAVAVGLNNGNIDGILNARPEDIDTYHSVLNKRRTTKKGKEQVDALLLVGKLIRDHLLDNGIHSLKIVWTGAEKVGSISSVAKDIFIENVNLRISVKESADVFINASPVKIFEHMPFGRFAHSERGVDWFSKIAKKEFDDYFLGMGV